MLLLGLVLNHYHPIPTSEYPLRFTVREFGLVDIKDVNKNRNP
jgi:hypothetical protein